VAETDIATDLGWPNPIEDPAPIIGKPSGLGWPKS